MQGARSGSVRSKEQRRSRRRKNRDKAKTRGGQNVQSSQKGNQRRTADYVTTRKNENKRFRGKGIGKQRSKDATGETAKRPTITECKKYRICWWFKRKVAASFRNMGAVFCLGPVVFRKLEPCFSARGICRDLFHKVLAILKQGDDISGPRYHCTCAAYFDSIQNNT